MNLLVRVDMGDTTVYSHETFWRINSVEEFEKTYGDLLIARMIITIAAVTNADRYELDRECPYTFAWDEKDMNIILIYHVKKI